RRDEDDVLLLVEQLLSLARRLKARVHELTLDLAVVLEVRERGRVGDEGDDERSAERRLAERTHSDARTCLVERGEVVGDLLPARQMAIGTGLVTEDRSRSRDVALRGRRAGREGDGRRGEEKESFH